MACTHCASGDITIDFWVRFQPSPDRSSYLCVLLVNRKGKGANFFDIQVQYPTRTLVVHWNKKHMIEGQTPLRANVRMRWPV